MRLSLGAAVLAVVVFAGAASGSSNPARSRPAIGPTGAQGPTVSSSRLVKGGHIRITASVKAHDGAKSVSSATVAATSASHRMYPEWEWTTAGPAGKADRYRCGETEFAGGGSDGPLVQFVSSCGR